MKPPELPNSSRSVKLDRRLNTPSVTLEKNLWSLLGVFHDTVSSWLDVGARIVKIGVNLERRLNTPFFTLDKNLWPVIGVLVCLSSSILGVRRVDSNMTSL